MKKDSNYWSILRPELFPPQCTRVTEEELDIHCFAIYTKNPLITHIPQFVGAFFHKIATGADFQRRAFIHLSQAAVPLRSRIRRAIAVREALCNRKLSL